MEGKIENYRSIQNAIFLGFFATSSLLALTSIESVERQLICHIGEHAFYILKIMPWGGFGAIMYSSFLSSKDKNSNQKRALLLAKDPNAEKPDYPDSYDVLMYFFYILSGFVLAALSTFLLETGIDYVSNTPQLPIRDKYGLFAIFAFYAGYSQADLIGKLRKKASESNA